MGSPGTPETWEPGMEMVKHTDCPPWKMYPDKATAWFRWQPFTSTFEEAAQ